MLYSELLVAGSAAANSSAVSPLPLKSLSFLVITHIYIYIYIDEQQSESKGKMPCSPDSSANLYITNVSLHLCFT